MMLLRRQSILQRCQHAIGGNRMPISSSTICGGNDIIITTAAAIRTLSLYSTSTLQQNYIGYTSSLQHVISRRIHKRQYHYHKPNNIIDIFNAANQLRQFSSTIGYQGTPYRGSSRGRGRGNDRGSRDRQSTNRIPNMKEFNTLDEAIEVYYDNLEALTPRNISSFWSAVPRLLRYQERGVNLVPQLEAIFLKTADQIHSYGPRDLATTTLGFAKIIQAFQRNKRGYVSGSYEGYLHGILISQRDEVFSFIARTAVSILHQFEPRDISNLAYAYALLEYVPKLNDGSNLFDHIAEKSIPLLNKFNPQALSNTVWAFEKVKVSHPTLYERVGDHIVKLDHLNDFKPQALSNILIAYAKAEVSHHKLFEKVGDHIVTLEHLNDFKPQELANIIYAYAKAGVSHHDLFNKVADHIVMLDQLNDFKPQDISNILIVYAKTEASHPNLFKKVADHIVTRQHLNDFIPQNLSNTVWSYAKAEVSHHKLFEKVGDHIVSLDHLNNFKPQSLSNIIYAYAKAGASHPNLFNKVACHIVSLDNSDGHNEQSILNLAWAYNKAGIIR